MKTVYKAQNLLVYRVSDEGEIQFRDTTRELGWKRSEFLTIKAQQLGLPAQEVLDKEARQQGWIAVKEAPQKDSAAPEETASEETSTKSNAVQLAGILVERQKRHGGEMTAQAFKEGLRTGGCGRSEGFIDYDSKGVSIRPDGEPEMKFTWAKFIKFCKENSLIKEEPTPCKPEPAPKPAAAATTETPAVLPQGKISTTSESEGDAEASTLEPSPPDAPTNLSDPASPADAGAATQSLSAAAPASSAVPSLDSSVFDFGADAETNAMLLQDAQIFMAGSMARVMAAKRAHDRTAHNYRGSWGKWCELVGISRDTGDNMVRVAEQFGNIQIDGQSLIDLQPMKLLYAASKPSTPPEARAKVESLEITSSKQFQELLAQLKAKEQELADEKAAHKAESAAFSEMFNDEQRLRREADEARRAAEKTAQGAKESYSIAQKNEALAIRRAKEAENQLADAQHRISELEARPVEVVGVDPDEIQRRAEKLAEEKTRELRSDMDQLVQEHDATVDALNAADQQRDVQRDVLTLARVLDAVNACEDLLRRQFEGLRHADYDRIYVPATDMMEDLCSKISQAIRDGEWPREEAEE